MIQRLARYFGTKTKADLKNTIKLKTCRTPHHTRDAKMVSVLRIKCERENAFVKK